MVGKRAASAVGSVCGARPGPEARVSTEVLITVLLGGDAGLRMGEMIALEQSDLDFRRRLLNVSRSDWHRQVTSPKGGRSRQVPMTEKLAAALLAHRHLRGPRVLYRQSGEPLSQQNLRTWLSTAQKRAGLPAKGALHILRHTFCSHLAMRNAPPLAIQQLAGHTSLRTTLRYMHLSPAEKDRAIRLLDEGRKAASAWRHTGDRAEPVSKAPLLQEVT